VTRGARTVLIVLLLAAGVWAIPGGGRTGETVGATLSTLILGAIVLLGVRLYREGRGRIELLGDAHRLLLYGALGTIVVAFAARNGLVDDGAGTALMVVLLLAAAAMLFAVYQRWRDV